MKICLTSLGFKILSIILSISTSLLLFLVIFYVDKFNFFAIIFCILVVIFCYFGMAACFMHKIIIKEDYILLKHIFSRKVLLNEVIDIRFSDEYNSNIIVFRTTEKLYRVSGYSNLKGYKNHLVHTEKIVNDIKKYLDALALVNRK